MKIVTAILTFIWTGCWFFIGIGIFLDTPKQIESDRVFLQTKIRPAVDFVYQFQKDSNKLPTNRQFYTWERDFYKDYSSNLNEKNDTLISDFSQVNYIRHTSNLLGDDTYNKFKNVDWTKDFAIGVWRGEWMEYYFSWSNSYDTNNYSWKDGLISLFTYCSIGLLPFVFWWRFYRREKKRSTQQKVWQ